MNATRLTGNPVVSLTESAADKVAELANAISADPRQEPVRFLAQARLAARQLPEGFWQLLECFRVHGSESGILVVRGLPVPAVPATPPNNSHHIGSTTNAAKITGLINSALGDMLGYEAEAGGRLFQDMVPTRSMAYTQTSQGSKVVLEAHTEQAFSRLRPDFLSLFCLRGHPDAATYVFPATDLLPHVTDAEVEMLRRPHWTFGVDESFRVGGHEFLEGDTRGPLPILSGPESDPGFLFDQDLQHGITKAAHGLLGKIIDVYCEHRRSHVLQPGDLLLLDNLRAIHGRSAFTPRFDGTDRFVLRSFIVRDLGRSRHARTGSDRIVTARYS
ncbi:TauD/TfdA family dioxygenase [Streptomyces avermitilis]|uniref:TauD/TfdA family dioxygenase n=1 Tax=Streptomyces avermitilis TaxID=33903 RepID=UPI0033EB64CA